MDQVLLAIVTHGTCGVMSLLHVYVTRLSYLSRASNVVFFHAFLDRSSSLISLRWDSGPAMRFAVFHGQLPIEYVVDGGVS